MFIDGEVDTTLSDNDYLVFNINPLKDFNEKNSSSVLSYEYSRGDRCTMLFYYSSGTTPVWFNNPAIDVEVAGFEITDAGNYLLKIRKSASLIVSNIENKNVLLEVYTPRLRTTVENGVTVPAEQLFFEIGEEIPITNGSYSVTSGTITDGDVYFKTRELQGAVDPNTLYSFLVEDFNFSDFCPSAYTSYGRPRSSVDEQGVVERKASIRYSETFQRGSLVNGLTRFYPENIYGDGDGETSSNYGWIRKIRQRNNVLVVLQELKVGYVPVFQSIVEDQQASTQYALSTKIFNYVRYNGKNIGMGNAKESYAEWNNNIYFVDPYRSEPIRAGLDGVDVISGKMSKYFKRVLQEVYEAGKKIIGYYDIFYNEYVLANETSGDILVSVAFNTLNWQLEDTYVIPANGISIATNGSKGVATYNTTTGIATYTPDNGETGTDNFTFSFTPSGGVLTTKRVCLTIVAGTTSVNSFDFLDVINAALSTLYVSNTILVFGNNIAVPISITGGEYSINGGAYTSSAGLVNANDFVSVRQTSSGTENTQTDTVLTISDKSATYSVTTLLAGFLELNLTINNTGSPASSGDVEFEITDTTTSTVVGTFSNGNTGSSLDYPFVVEDDANTIEILVTNVSAPTIDVQVDGSSSQTLAPTESYNFTGLDKDDLEAFLYSFSPSDVPVDGENITAAGNFSIVFYNTFTGISYNGSMSTPASYTPIRAVPASNNYTVTINSSGGGDSYDYDVAGSTATSTSGSVVFNNIDISSGIFISIADTPL